MASWLGFGAYWVRQRAVERRLAASSRRARLEESRVFEFLHGLGEAFSGEVRSDELYRLLVAGAMRALDSQGGALYLVNRESQALVARFVSPGCPPVIEVPEHVLAQVAANPQALDSYRRLHAIEAGEGALGQAWREGRAMLLGAADQRLAVLRDPQQATASAMFAPLIYGRETMGVLALANGAAGRAFDRDDFVVFKAIAEQSAFALFNALVYREAGEKRRLDSDLRVARDIQRILLPHEVPIVEGYEIAASNSPARHVSGDYFDFLQIDADRMGLAIADVSGKGVPASLISAMCRSVLRSHAPGGTSSAAVLRKVNRQLYPDIKEDMFISMAYLILDRRSSAVNLCRAGHDAPFLYSAKTHTVEKINPPGMAMGIDSGGVFDRVSRDFALALAPGDCLVLYTDGVTEALDASGAEFGVGRVVRAIQASAEQGAGAIIDRISGDVREFIGDTPKHDDITLIAIRKT